MHGAASARRNVPIARTGPPRRQCPCDVVAEEQLDVFAAARHR